MARHDHPYAAKHKEPEGHGSLCPADRPADAPQKLLDTAVVVEGLGARKLWAASGEWCFCAHRSPHAGADAWHGFPVIGGEVDERVLEHLEAAGQITPHERRRLRRQRKLPETWR